MDPESDMPVEQMMHQGDRACAAIELVDPCQFVLPGTLHQDAGNWIWIAFTGDSTDAFP